MTVVNPLPIPSGLLEYMFDETRAIFNLLLSETVTRCPDIKFIMSHAGGVLPPVLERVAVALQTFFGAGVDSNGMKRLLRERFHFDLAGVDSNGMKRLLRERFHFDLAGVDSNGMKRLLRERFHFDLAGVPWPDTIHALLRIVGPERLVYGSDYCWTPPALVKTLIKGMDEGAEEIWGEDTIKEVYAGNAKKLFGL
jgi:predicted TIM-barrel fold metal-dependent hydrolase